MLKSEAVLDNAKFRSLKRNRDYNNVSVMSSLLCNIPIKTKQKSNTGTRTPLPNFSRTLLRNIAPRMNICNLTVSTDRINSSFARAALFYLFIFFYSQGLLFERFTGYCLSGISRNLLVCQKPIEIRRTIRFFVVAIVESSMDTGNPLKC